MQDSVFCHKIGVGWKNDLFATWLKKSYFWKVKTFYSNICSAALIFAFELVLTWTFLRFHEKKGLGKGWEKTANRIELFSFGGKENVWFTSNLYLFFVIALCFISLRKPGKTNVCSSSEIFTCSWPLTWKVNEKPVVWSHGGGKTAPISELQLCWSEWKLCAFPLFLKGVQTWKVEPVISFPCEK